MRRVGWWAAVFTVVWLTVCGFAFFGACDPRPVPQPMPTVKVSPHEEVPVWQRIPDEGARPQ